MVEKKQKIVCKNFQKCIVSSSFLIDLLSDTECYPIPLKLGVHPPLLTRNTLQSTRPPLQDTLWVDRLELVTLELESL